MSFSGVLKQSTAVDIIAGPFVDSLDGDSEETALTIARADVILSKNAGVQAQKTETTSATHRADGFYLVPLDATDTNTVGRLTLWIHVAGALAVRHDFQVVEELVYDAYFASAAAFGGLISTMFATLMGGATLEQHTQFQTDALSAAPIVRANTVASATASTLVLDAGASAADDAYNGYTVLITAGPGEGQARYVSDYVGATKTITPDGNWTVNPTSASRFIIYR